LNEGVRPAKHLFKTCVISFGSPEVTAQIGEGCLDPVWHLRVYKTLCKCLLVERPTCYQFGRKQRSAGTLHVGVRMRRQKEVSLSVRGSRARWFESVPECSNAKDPAPLKVNDRMHGNAKSDFSVTFCPELYRCLFNTQSGQQGEDMVGIVLAAGMGYRLRPYTDTLPKALLPVYGDVTILDIVLRNLARVEIAEVIVVVGYRAAAVEELVHLLEERYDIKLSLIYNDRAKEWNNAYSLWLARDHFARGALLVNGDTVHPDSVERTLLAAPCPGITLAIDAEKRLADEEMKVIFRPDGRLAKINIRIDPASAHGEYIGVSLFQPGAGAELEWALRATWARDPSLYYEDAYQLFLERGGCIAGVSIGASPGSRSIIFKTWCSPVKSHASTPTDPNYLPERPRLDSKAGYCR
jgi:choline kinase